MSYTNFPSCRIGSLRQFSTMKQSILKNVLSRTFVALTLSACVLSCSDSDSESPSNLFTVNGITYRVIGTGEVAVTALPDIQSINIPSSVTDGKKNYVVTTIGEGETLLPIANEIKSVTLPSTARIIADQAFRDCGYLERVNLPTSLTSIGEYAFRNCVTLKNVTLPLSLTHMGTGAFSWTGIEKITLPLWLTRLPDEAFYNCELKEVNIPPFLISIGRDALNIPVTSVIDTQKTTIRCFSIFPALCPSGNPFGTYSYSASLKVLFGGLYEIMPYWRDMTDIDTFTSNEYSIDTRKLVASWKVKESSDTWTFNADGTYAISGQTSETGTWRVEDNVVLVMTDTYDRAKKGQAYIDKDNRLLYRYEQLSSPYSSITGTDVQLSTFSQIVTQ